MTNKNPYNEEMPIDTPLICITKYIIDKVEHYGLTLRYYAGEAKNGHKVFASGHSKNQTYHSKVIYFDDFLAIVKHDDFKPLWFIDNPSYYIDKYRVRVY